MNDAKREVSLWLLRLQLERPGERSCCPLLILLFTLCHQRARQPKELNVLFFWRLLGCVFLLLFDLFVLCSRLLCRPAQCGIGTSGVQTARTGKDGREVVLRTPSKTPFFGP